MPDFNIYAGDTSKTIYVKLRDSTTGLAKTGLAFNTSGILLSYTLPLAARAAITPATQTVTGAWSSGGFVEVDATNEKGLYRLDLPDAAIASGAFTIICVQFTGVIEEAILIPLAIRKVNLVQILGTTLTETAGLIAAGFKKFFNVATPTGTVNSLPDAVPGAANGLVIAGTNAPITFTGSGAAMTLASTGGNGAGLAISGNGSGHGFSATGGATGVGVRAIGGATSGRGMYVTSTANNDNAFEADAHGTGIDFAGVLGDFSVTTRAEPAQGTPPATTTAAIKTDYLYKIWRNKKTKTAIATNYFNDDAATIDHKTTDSDDGTTGTRGEVATGP